MSVRYAVRAAASAVAAFVAALGLIGAPDARAAATVTVEPNSVTVNPNDGQCSLPEAISSANSNNASGVTVGECPAGLTGGTIHVPDGPGNTGGTYVLPGELAITAPITITGTANHPTVASNGSSRVFAIDSGVTASISGLEIANGKDSIGGGILNSGNLTLTDDVIDDNTTVDGVPQGGVGTAGGRGGGLYNLGNATLSSVQVTNNTTGKGGGGEGSGVGFAGEGGAGAGIYNAAGGRLTLTDSQVTHNTTGAGGLGGNGGVGGPGGGIANIGTLTASGDTIDHNSTGAGGISQGQPGGSGGQGGGIAAFGTTTITNSSISSNTTGVGGGFESGGQNGPAGPGAGIGSDFTLGGSQTLTSLSVTDTTIADNARGSDQGADATGVGGGIHLVTLGPATVSLTGTAVTGSSGIGIAAKVLGSFSSGPVQLSLRNVTLANSGGAGLFATTQNNGGTPSFSVNVGFSTIAGNGGPGLESSAQTNPAPAPAPPTVTATDSLFASNQACAGVITDGGHNLSFGNAACPGANADPKLGTLGNHGGPTETIPLLAGSPAIDAIPASDSTCTGADQRGVARPGGSGCDIGAYEVAAPRVSGAAAAGTGTTSGNVTAQVTPVGTSATSVTVRYGTTTGYGATATGPTLAAGAGASAVSVPLTGLTAGTTYHAQVVATDAEGTTSSQDITFTTSRTSGGNGGGGGGGGKGGGSVRPRLSGLAISPSAFRVAAGHGGSIARSTGATVRYSDSTAATTTFTVQRMLTGHRAAKGRCSTKPVRRGSHARTCTLMLTLRGSFSHQDTSGKSSFHFTGRLRNTPLPTGHYRLIAVARLGGKASPAVSHSFTIVR